MTNTSSEIRDGRFGIITSSIVLIKIIFIIFVTLLTKQENIMTEAEYIESTNLCKLRIVKSILTDCYIDEKYGIKQKEYNLSILAICECIKELEKRQNI